MKPSLVTLATGIVLFTWHHVADAARKKRYLFINTEAPITLGFILNMPVSLALPTLAPVAGRSFGFQSSNLYEDQESPDDLYWEPAYEQQLNRLAVYFAHLELYTLPCQERLICELASDPEGFSPIGEIFMKELRLMHGPVKTTRDSLMWRYMTAAREGFNEECSGAYSSCPLAANRILNMAVLKVWQYIATKLNLQLV
ncbi:hypothetical protein SK128_018212 [Halocaridina rubra]|uniref:Uncharacterized protein n=1 Tax=Halocaridina rubra TaxID=373956 RepID=A0AAN8WL13_HALRR